MPSKSVESIRIRSIFGDASQRLLGTAKRAEGPCREACRTDGNETVLGVAPSLIIDVFRGHTQTSASIRDLT